MEAFYRFIKHNRWKLYWLGLFAQVSICGYLFWLIGLWQADSIQEQRVEVAIESLGAFAGVYLTLLIYLKSGEDANIKHRDALEHQQALHEAQMKLLMSANERQIELWREALTEQTNSIVGAIDHQTHSMREENRIKEDERKTAKQLGYERRKLEHELIQAQGKLKTANAQLTNARTFKLLRSKHQKNKDIAEATRLVHQWQAYVQDLIRRLSDLDN